MPTTVTQSQQIRTSRAGTRTKPPEDLRASTKELISSIERSWFDVSKNLYIIESENKWMEWGFQSMQDYVETELGYTYRTMRHRISVGRTIVNLGLTHEQVDGIGEWTKLKAIRPLLEDENLTKEEMDRIFEEAKTKSVRQLEEMVVSQKTQSEHGVQIFKVGFSLTEGQMLSYKRVSESIMKSTTRKLPGQILEYLCLHFELNEIDNHIMEWVVNNREKVLNMIGGNDHGSGNEGSTQSD